MNDVQTIVRMVFGSHLYGTDTPASDLDFKGVHIPAAADILLGRAGKAISSKRAKAPGEKNAAGEQDEESYSLLNFLRLASEGQTVALDMLFAPDDRLTDCSPLWDDIRFNRHKLLTRKSASFLGYCRTQANKYGIKGSRVAAARAALNLLSEMVGAVGAQAKLGDIAYHVRALGAETEQMSIVQIEQVNGSLVSHWDVCGRKMAFTASIGNAHGVMQRLVQEYGARALAAEKNEGVDWKALSHAVRVGFEALELLKTGYITFPLPNAQHILAIKKGELPYQAVAEEIEQLLELVEDTAQQSVLPEEPDHAWIEAFVLEHYREHVIG